MRNKDKKTTILCYRTMSDFINQFQNADGGLLLLCYEDDGTAPKNIEAATLTGKLVLKDKGRVYTYNDAHFVKNENSALLQLTPEETAALEPGVYALQLEYTDTKKSISISDYRIKIIKTY